MVQFAFPVLDPDVNDGTQLADYLNNVWPAVYSSHAGNSRPAYALSGLLWIDASVAGSNTLKLFDGTQDVTIGAAAGGVFTVDPSAIDAYTKAQADALFLPLTGGTITNSTGSQVVRIVGKSTPETQNNFDAGLTVLGANSGDLPAFQLSRPGGTTVKLYITSNNEFAIGSGTWPPARFKLASTGEGTFIHNVNALRFLTNSVAQGVGAPTIEAYGAGNAPALSNFDSTLRIRTPSGAPVLSFYKESPSTIFNLYMDGAGQFVIGGGSWNTNRLVLNSSGNLAIAGAASKPGGGAWADSSDERIKTNVQPFDTGLAAILALEPVSYRYKPETGRDPNIPYVGLIAQSLEDGPLSFLVTQEEITLGDITLPDMRVLDTSALVWVLVNAIKQMHEHIGILEENLRDTRRRIARLEQNAGGAAALGVLGPCEELPVDPCVVRRSGDAEG